MGNGANYIYGPVTDYSIKMQMNNAANRGFTWGAVDVPPTAALSATGNFQVAGSVTGAGGIFTTLTNDGNVIQNITHGNNAVQFLSAARNGGGTGDAGLYSWISEPGATWTGAGIARNMSNSAAGYPRVNTGLTGQMIRFDEGTNIIFTVETAAGARTTVATMAPGGITAPAFLGNATSATSATTASTAGSGSGRTAAVSTDYPVASMIRWKNYGVNHVIFDASQGTSPDGGAINNSTPSVDWAATYPTLMGWNGSNTYGVRVERATKAYYAP
jgi:hypothetical protein